MAAEEKTGVVSQLLSAITNTSDKPMFKDFDSRFLEVSIHGHLVPGGSGPVAAQDAMVEGCGAGLFASWQLRSGEGRKKKRDPVFPQRLKSFQEALPYV